MPFAEVKASVLAVATMPDITDLQVLKDLVGHPDPDPLAFPYSDGTYHVEIAGCYTDLSRLEMEDLVAYATRCGDAVRPHLLAALREALDAMAT